MTNITQALPPTLRELITEWLADNPGWRTSTEIITGLRRSGGPPPIVTQSVYNEIRRMLHDGVLMRQQTMLPGSTTQRSFYLLPVDVSSFE